MKIYLIVLLLILFKFNLFSFDPNRQKGESEERHYDRISNTFLYGWKNSSAIVNNDRRPELQMKDGSVMMDYCGISTPMRPFIFTKEDADYIRTYSRLDNYDGAPVMGADFDPIQDKYINYHTNRPRLTSLDTWRKCMVRTKFGKDTIIPQMDKIVRVHFVRIRVAHCNPSISIRFRLESNPYLRNASSQYREFHFNNDPSKKDDIHRLRLAHVYHQGKIEYAQKREEEIKKFAIQYWGRKRLSDHNINWSLEGHIKSNKLEEAFEAVSIKDNGRVFVNGKDLEDVHKSLLTTYYVISQRVDLDTLPTRTDLKYNFSEKPLELPFGVSRGDLYRGE